MDILQECVPVAVERRQMSHSVSATQLATVDLGDPPQTLPDDPDLQSFGHVWYYRLCICTVLWWFGVVVVSLSFLAETKLLYTEPD